MNNFCRSIVSFGRKHDNVLFAIGEIALGTAAVIFAVKNTAKYIEDHDEDSVVDGNTPVEKAKDLGSHYWQTGVCLGGFIALRSLDCIYTGDQKREYSKALLAAQAALLRKRPCKTSVENEDGTKTILSDPDMGEHPEGNEMVEARGEKAYDQYGYCFYFYNDEMPDVEYSVYNQDGYGKKEAFYIPATGRFFISTLEDVKRAEHNIDEELSKGTTLFLNDIYKQLGIGSDGMGHDEYIEGYASDDDDPFSFDLAPGMLDYNDGFGSVDLIYTINPNRWIYNINIPRD